MKKLCLIILAVLGIAALVSGRDNEEVSSLTEDLTSARLVRSFDVSRGKPRNAKKEGTSRQGKKGRKGNEGSKGANKDIDKRKNKGNKQIRILTAFQEYKKATNQKKKANRVRGWFRMLAKKVNNSRTFFVEAAEFFKDCPEGLSVYQQLRYQNNNYNHETFY